jgi:hypothetical protein
MISENDSFLNTQDKSNSNIIMNSSEPYLQIQNSELQREISYLKKKMDKTENRYKTEITHLNSIIQKNEHYLNLTKTYLKNLIQRSKQEDSYKNDLNNISFVDELM